jgi:hypothetical protein
MPSHSGPVAQLDRASDYESEGRAFESLRVHHFQENSFGWILLREFNAMAFILFAKLIAGLEDSQSLHRSDPARFHSFVEVWPDSPSIAPCVRLGGSIAIYLALI